MLSIHASWRKACGLSGWLCVGHGVLNACYAFARFSVRFAGKPLVMRPDAMARSFICGVINDEIVIWVPSGITARADSQPSRHHHVRRARNSVHIVGGSLPAVLLPDNSRRPRWALLVEL